MKNRKTLNTASLSALLKRVNLSGLVEECVLKVENNVGSVSAIDMTNSVLICVNEPLPGLANGEYGISQISTLIKFLAMCKGEDITYSISEDKKWMTLYHKGHGKLSVLLLENDMVGTRLTDEPKIHKQISKYPIALKLKGRFVEDALSYIGLGQCQSVVFTIRKDRAILVSSLSSEQQKFEVVIGEVKNATEEVAVTVYAEQVSKVLSTIELLDDSSLYIKKEHPIIIAQDEKNIWALTPIVT